MIFLSHRVLIKMSSLGMVELVPSSDTLRKIQVEYGVTGSFKDKPLAEWLRKYNPAEDEYEKVRTKISFVLNLSKVSTYYFDCTSIILFCQSFK